MEDMRLLLQKAADAFEREMHEKEKWMLTSMCYDAMIIYLEENCDEALEKMQDLCKRHATSAIVHRCYAEILARFVDEFDLEGDELQSNWDEAIKEARAAVSLAPDDAEMARFLARMLLIQAKTLQDFEEVSRVCDALLAIPNPVAHGLERLEADTDSVSHENRLEMILIDLEILRANSSVDTISGWLKSMPGEGDRIRLLPSVEKRVRAVEAEDSSLSEQQQSSATVSEPSDEMFGAGERTNVEGRRNAVRSYLNGLTVEEKKDFLKVKVRVLREHFGSLGADSKSLATSVLFDALRCAQATKNWRDYKCGDCGRKFVDAKLLIQHSLHDHIGNLILPEAKSLLPKKEWVELLVQDPPSSSERGASDEITSFYSDVCGALALLKIEEGDHGGVGNQGQAPDSGSVIAYDRKSSLLIFDDHKLPNGDVEGFLSSLVDELEERDFPGTCEALRTWSGRINKVEKPRALFMSLEKELTLINLNLEKMCEHLKYMKELLALEDQYSGESVRAEGDIGLLENYWATIRKRRYELFGLGDEMVFAGNRFEIKALSNMLKDADSQEPDSQDRFPGAVFRRQMTKADEQLKKYSEELESKLDHVEKLLYEELVPTSTVDYEAILLTLLKSYMQIWLEDSAQKNAFLKVYTASKAAKAGSSEQGSSSCWIPKCEPSHIDCMSVGRLAYN